MDQLFLALDRWKNLEANKKTFSVPMETLVLFFALKFLKSPTIDVILVKQDLDQTSTSYYVVDDKDLYSDIVLEMNIPQSVKDCVFPAVLIEGKNTCIAGLCAVLRHLIKKTVWEMPTHPCRSLLGFRNGCLIACAEASTWTRFCEVDILHVTSSIVEGNCEKSDAFLKLPEELAKFEKHLQQPVRIHNIRKRQQENAKLLQAANSWKESKDEKNVGNKTSGKQSQLSVELQHTYAEGPDMTLADVILFACYHIMFEYLKSVNLYQYIPLTMKWFQEVLCSPLILESRTVIIETRRVKHGEVLKVIVPDVPDESLHKKDPRRYKPRNRIFTRQEDIEKSLEIISYGRINIHYEDHSWKTERGLDWTSLPTTVHPQGGDLPISRLQRKCVQLENVAQAVLKIAKQNEVIVDFCSGGGHLGILLAYLLPSCTVVMVENKEESLGRAKARVTKLGLKNVFFYQCNLDYYKGSFTIGMSLHACGVATDLVLQRCIDHRAAYVSCPCCYGSVQNTHIITYPRSKTFRSLGLTLRDYLVVGHAADQTHDEKNAKTEQGKLCMGVIDSDRNLQAVEEGYIVMLCKMRPESCSPKNNLLIGVPSEKVLETSLSLAED